MRDHQLDLDQIVNRDGSSLIVDRLVPPSRNGVENRLTHVRQRFNHPAILQLSDDGNHALEKDRPLTLGGEGLARIADRLARKLLRTRHSLAERKDVPS